MPDWSSKTVLIAEDLDDNYAVLSALLKRTRIKLLRAYTGEEAVRLVLTRQDIDAVLMDISMPDMDGIEALREIRKQIPEQIVIAQTAHGLSPLITDESFNDIILKPISRKQLIETLNKYLS